MNPFPGMTVNSSAINRWPAWTTIYDSVKARGDGLSETLVGGDNVLMHFVDYNYLEETSEASFVLILTALSGSAQVKVTYGSHSDWEYTDEFTTTYDGGTHTLAGPGELLVPLSEWTVPFYWNMDERPLVYLEILSGSVAVDQVRLRVWPPGGPLGYWSDVVTPTVPVGPIQLTSGSRHEPFVDRTTDPPDLPYGSQRVVWTNDDADRAAAFELGQTLARTDIQEANLAFVRSITTGIAFGDPVVRAGGSARTIRHHGAAFTSEAQGAVTTADTHHERSYFTLFDPDASSAPAGVQGVDWIRHPDRTTADLEYRTILEGTPTWTWVQGSVEWMITGSMSSGLGIHYLIGGYYFRATYASSAPPSTYDSVNGWYEAPWNPITSASGSVAMVDDSNLATPQITGEVALPPITGRILVFEASHDLNFGHLAHSTVYGDPDSFTQSTYDAGAGGISVYCGTYTTLTEGTRTGYTPLSYTVLRSPYRFWDPNAIPPDPPEEFDATPPAGYFLDPSMNLAGLFDGVDVNFSS